jgi:hypothetical protein
MDYKYLPQNGILPGVKLYKPIQDPYCFVTVDWADGKVRIIRWRGTSRRVLKKAKETYSDALCVQAGPTMWITR